MILPTVTAAAIDAIRGAPRDVWEAARGLGLTRAQALRAVMVPRALHGLAAGLVIGVARAAGETAPIMFTAVVLTGAIWPEGIGHSPVQALPYAIWHSAQDTIDATSVARGWAAALFLTSMSVLLMIAVAPLRRRLHEEAA
jgi:phosphate transport system permease protein